MTIKAAQQHSIRQLTPLFGSREAQNLTRILFEDGFQIYASSSDSQFSEVQLDRLNDLHRQLRERVPVQYLVGKAHFYNLVFCVSPDVLIPRPETEEMVHLLLTTLSQAAPLCGIDIGTGTGCIPIVLKYQRPHWTCHATDISGQALTVARQNAETHQVEVRFHCFDILNSETWPSLPRFDFIVSNPPYIPPSEQQLLSPEVQDHEPHLALFTPGEDPLVFYRAIVAFAKKQLKEGGHLFFEVNEFHAKKVVELLRGNGFVNVLLENDMQGKGRMVVGMR